MSAATVMRLLPERQVPRGLALLNGGNALATTIAAPLGSFLGQYVGWRGAFFVVVPLAAITFVWQWLTLPAMPSNGHGRQASAFGLLRRPGACIGMAAVGLLFAGQFGLFIYVRPFLEGVTQLSVSALSLVLLLMGVNRLPKRALAQFRCRYARFGRHSMGGCLPWCIEGFGLYRRLVC
jgi:predicted MFS family arabinose efflux permease